MFLILWHYKPKHVESKVTITVFFRAYWQVSVMSPLYWEVSVMSQTSKDVTSDSLHLLFKTTSAIILSLDMQYNVVISIFFLRGCLPVWIQVSRALCEGYTRKKIAGK